jgi:putative addiction module component (TIGR02574 family)
VEEIWDSIVAEQESFAVTEAQRDELDRRLESYRTSPATGTPWEDVKKGFRPEK